MSTRRVLWRILMVSLSLILAVGAILYGSLLRNLEEADAAFLRQDLTSSTSRYESGLSTFDRHPFLKPLLRHQLEMAVLHYAELLYHQGHYEQAVKTLETQAAEFRYLATAAPFHLWMGNALFRVAILQQGQDVSSESLQMVADEYREALRIEPDNWDVKHNYEFVQSLQEKKRSGRAGDDKNLQILLSAIRLTTEQRTGGLPAKLQ